MGELEVWRAAAVLQSGLSGEARVGHLEPNGRTVALPTRAKTAVAAWRCTVHVNNN